MDKIKYFFKFLQIIILFIIPAIVTYWVLNLIELNFLNGITSLLGMLLDPLIGFFNMFFHYEMEHAGYMIDFTPMALVLFLFIVFLIAGQLEKIIESTRLAIIEGQERTRQKTEREEQQQIQNDFIDSLGKNKVHYLLIKFNKHDTALSYLSNAFGDEEKDNIANDIIKNILSTSKKLGSTHYNRLYDETDIFNFIFYDIDSALRFAKYLQQEVKKQAAELIKIGANIEFAGVLHCTMSEYSSNTDLPVMEKVVNLAETNEILATELYKNKAELFHNANVQFTTKGIYALNGKRSEIYSVIL